MTEKKLMAEQKSILDMLTMALFMTLTSIPFF